MIVMMYKVLPIILLLLRPLMVLIIIVIVRGGRGRACGRGGCAGGRGQAARGVAMNGEE